METRRPTIPAAEEILGRYYPVLDHGFVALVDYMGSDEAVEQAARVSYGAGTRKVSQTRGLIRYLRRHHHTTPSEMVELKFHCAMPMFVARQWIRHRTACLAEGTEVELDPGPQRGRARPRSLRIEQIWACVRSARHAVGPDARAIRVRHVDEETLEPRSARVVDVHRNGRRPVFRMQLSDGRSVEATADHRFLFAEGWRSLRQATGLERAGSGASWRRGDYQVRVAPPTIEPPVTEPVAPVGGGAGVTYATRPTIRHVASLARIDRFEYVGVKETYDLEVEGPWHNFVANGIVTHNSVNELSARYSLMPLLFYKPEAEHFALQSRSNKQGREQGAPPEVYREAVERWERLRSQAGDAYTWLLEQDVAREIARIDLPVSTYTQWYWKIDLHNLLHFLTLRVDERAQWEIREFARVIAAMMRRVAPLTYEAWVDYDLEARRFTRAERDVLARLLEAGDDGVRARDGAVADAEALKAAGLSPREIRELVEKLQQPGLPDFDLDLSRMRTADEVAAEMYEAVPGSFE